MLFYQSCFGGELAMHFVNESPEGKVFPQRMHRYVVEAVLSAEDIKIFGTDLGLEEQLSNGNRVSLLVQAHDREHLGKLYHSLSFTSGTLTTLVGKGEISNVRDRFGVQWLIYY
jgi:PhnB protein